MKTLAPVLFRSSVPEALPEKKANSALLTLFYAILTYKDSCDVRDRDYSLEPTLVLCRVASCLTLVTQVDPELFGTGQDRRDTALWVLRSSGGAFQAPPFYFSCMEVTTLTQRLVSYRHFKGLIFDWDGVIADTHLDFSPIRQRFFNGRSVPLIEGIHTLSPEVAQQAREAIETEERRGACEATAVPGALDFLQWLDKQNIPWCVMSRNNLSSLEVAAQAIGLNLPEITITRDSPFIKPDHRSMIDAAHRLGLLPSQCLAVGDFVFELLAARRASMRVVLVEQSGVPWEDLADAVYPRMIDFVTAFMEGDSFVPWEYHRFDQHKRTQQLFDLSTPEGWQSLDRFLASGVTELVLPHRPFSIDEWRACPGLSPVFLHEPLFQVIQQVFAPRYPLLTVSPCQEEQP